MPSRVRQKLVCFLSVTLRRWKQKTSRRARLTGVCGRVLRTIFLEKEQGRHTGTHFQMNFYLFKFCKMYAPAEMHNLKTGHGEACPRPCESVFLHTRNHQNLLKNAFKPGEALGSRRKDKRIREQWTTQIWQRKNNHFAIWLHRSASQQPKELIFWIELAIWNPEKERGNRCQIL